jgi:hypothetical protein
MHDAGGRQLAVLRDQRGRLQQRHPQLRQRRRRVGVGDRVDAGDVQDAGDLPGRAGAADDLHVELRVVVGDQVGEHDLVEGHRRLVEQLDRDVLLPGDRAHRRDTEVSVRSVEDTAPASAAWTAVVVPVATFGRLIESVPEGSASCRHRFAVVRPKRGRSTYSSMSHSGGTKKPP